MAYRSSVDELCEAVLNGNIDKLHSVIENGVNINISNKDGYAPLVTAVWSGNLEIVRYLLEAGANIEKREKSGHTALTLAARRRYLEIVEFLLSSGANMDECDGNGNTALANAVRSGKLEVVQRLISGGADVDKVDGKGGTPLTFAAAKGSMETVELLLEKGADINVCDGAGSSPLAHAAWAGRLNIVKCLVEAGADVNKVENRGGTPLTWAVAKGHTDIITLLLDKGADVNRISSNGFTALTVAVLCGKREVVEKLLSVGAHSEANEKNELLAVNWTIRNGHFEVAEVFLQHWAVMKRSALVMWAVENNCLELLQYLASGGANLNKRNNYGYTPLACAIDKKNPNLAKWLLQNGADFSVHDALLHAINSQDLEILQRLIKKNADVNKLYRNGDTPLIKAIELNNCQVVNLLLKNGADPNLPDGNDKLPLHYALGNDKFEILTSLINYGALIDDEDNLNPNMWLEDGHTFLTKSVENRNLMLTRSLLSRKVDVNFANRNGKTPLVIAASQLDLDLVNCLIKHGADVATAEIEIRLFIDAVQNYSSYVNSVRRVPTVVYGPEPMSPRSFLHNTHKNSATNLIFNTTTERVSKSSNHSLENRSSTSSSNQEYDGCVRFGRTTLPEEESERGSHVSTQSTQKSTFVKKFLRPLSLQEISKTLKIPGVFQRSRLSSSSALSDKNSEK